ncbi:MAG: pantothenate kinase [bacterium (Candidatus Ratteibacteria) CG_4_10_14_3_um_filter_41_18]|uniref:Type III pantothenate kinase n=3 Tax=Candidatus Ratteibacteria TaxID=2979319 RepID=A0A2M7EAN1_9BACT|nr:MAG: pantothenate kinase [bacterium (Candidatus Ratteibacteria) CG01_land_8_20_14_3_00_40_19]PIW74321.1 MAG: pantothenate kinase [bacterium (Candidatus Ratteibacteria) CG_4_8_14_3_um_filter_41_36]PIX77832.1 MAG: pantothenate kinase [bacterium (Candidatus Ratteibacteria) CG_4_10_14_3_um_filter_41_18]PJA62142.1 MAG: pantothenate kinase [bacterium (Candidatus Ratteibacteria) CG_4_9_14_3_um_filter_41_21]HCG76519.1 pantothenate kinase [bacterium]
MVLLAIDIGNSQIDLGLFRGKRLIKSSFFPKEDWRKFPLKKFIGEKKVSRVFIASVVPSLTGKIALSCRRNLSLKPEIIKAKDCGIPIKIKNPKEVGVDRVLNALAAFSVYRKPAIIVDAGTATTLDLVSEKGAYLGGIILPGLRISAEALAEKTALLPKIPIKRPKTLMGKGTISAIQSGIIYGSAEAIAGLIRKIKKDYRKKLLVIGTGGWIETLAPLIKSIDNIQPYLTLKGLALIGATRKK